MQGTLPLTGTQRSRHYLAEHYQTLGRVDLDYRSSNLLVRAIYPTAAVKGFATMQVRIVKISTEGALLHGHLLSFLPDQFYLCLGEREIFITCAKRHLEDDRMAIVFAKPETQGFVQALSRITQPISTLKRLRGAAAPVIEARITTRTNG
ncbi:hypothetical protein [Rhizobium sp. SSA_523]|uniref:hypothetical protein n=1 Tax=Rhizobium sp. SSA_523 TaxID=2952477 RepID=UPI0020906B5B|nr:hypothetical protein [Rhizobium sp. SSA_523]MCO5732122.1 hypothetical protein [Rhizobium sp. SSA_523]WKC25632.1 hypothetical protein QTJ18_16905 [Rhizobium sp. SSA_523]